MGLHQKMRGNVWKIEINFPKEHFVSREQSEGVGREMFVSAITPLALPQLHPHFIPLQILCQGNNRGVIHSYVI